MMDKKIETFIADLESVMPKNAKIIKDIRKKIFKIKPDLIETIMYGGLVYKDINKPLFGLFSRKNHVTIEIGNGAFMADPHNVLEGKGNKEGRKHIKIEKIEEIKAKFVELYLSESTKI